MPCFHSVYYLLPSFLFFLSSHCPSLASWSPVELAPVSFRIDSINLWAFPCFLAQPYTSLALSWDQPLPQGAPVPATGDCYLETKFLPQTLTARILFLHLGRYSTNEGETWKTFIFSEKPVFVYGLLTEPGEKSTVFTIFGSNKENIHSWLILQVNATNALGKPLPPWPFS